MRIVTGSDAVVPSPAFAGADGHTITDATATPTCTVTRDNGNTVTHDAPAAGDTNDGTYTIKIPAASLTTPDRLTVTWTATVDTLTQELVQIVDVVGGVYVPLTELWRLKDMPVAKMSVTDALELRDEFEDLAEEYLNQAWVPRFARETHDRARGSVVLDRMKPRSIVSATAVFDGAPVDTTSWQLEPTGLVHCVDFWAPVTIRYTHGADRPPAALVTACKDYVRAKALERFGGNRIGRDLLESTDGSGGSMRYSTPDWNAGRPTGYLDVDRTLNSLGAPIPGIA